jgi:hypothetical protein
MVYLRLLGFWTLSIVRYSKEHNVSETGSVYVLRSVVGRHLLCWVRYKELTSVFSNNVNTPRTRKALGCTLHLYRK